jgi:hypothetical protein
LVSFDARGCVSLNAPGDNVNVGLQLHFQKRYAASTFEPISQDRSGILPLLTVLYMVGHHVESSEMPCLRQVSLDFQAVRGSDGSNMTPTRMTKNRV